MVVYGLDSHDSAEGSCGEKLSLKKCEHVTFADHSDEQFVKMFIGMEPSEDKVNKYKETLKLIDTLIGDNNYLTGDELTIADLTILATTMGIEGKGFGSAGDSLLSGDYPNAKRWIEKLKTELPYYEEINGFEAEEIKVYAEKIKNRIAQMANQK